jgi:hypothetical protein
MPTSIFLWLININKKMLFRNRLKFVNYYNSPTCWTYSLFHSDYIRSCYYCDKLFLMNLRGSLFPHRDHPSCGSLSHYNAQWFGNSLLEYCHELLNSWSGSQ